MAISITVDPWRCFCQPKGSRFHSLPILYLQQQRNCRSHKSALTCTKLVPNSQAEMIKGKQKKRVHHCPHELYIIAVCQTSLMTLHITLAAVIHPSTMNEHVCPSLLDHCTFSPFFHPQSLALSISVSIHHFFAKSHPCMRVQ